MTVTVGGTADPVTVRLGLGVSEGEASGVATLRGVGVAVNSVTTGAAVGGVSIGEQPPKIMAARQRTGQILATN